MKLIIRDDDVSYFTQPEDLERWFSGIWDKVPICLSIIPLIYAGQEETPIGKRDKQIHSIGENGRLCNFLKYKQKEGKVKIWQHGTTHRDWKGKYECEIMHHHIWYGHKELENIFGPIKIFVAPHDRFSKNSIKEIEKIGMDICRGFSPLPREFRLTQKYIHNLTTLGMLWYFYRTKYRWPHMLNYGKHKELYSYRLGEIKNIDDVLDWHKDSTLCITVHHRTMNQYELEKLQYIIRRAQNG